MLLPYLAAFTFFTTHHFGEEAKRDWKKQISKQKSLISKPTVIHPVLTKSPVQLRVVDRKAVCLAKDISMLRVFMMLSDIFFPSFFLSFPLPLHPPLPPGSFLSSSNFLSRHYLFRASCNIVQQLGGVWSVSLDTIRIEPRDMAPARKETVIR